MTPGFIFSVLFCVAVVVSMFQPSDSSRRYAWFALGAALFVFGDLVDLLTVGTCPSPLQRALGVSELSYWIGRMVVFGALGVLHLVLASRFRSLGK